ncbi:MAG: nuclear transport factor 2 family protein [Alphaproteobacteria bacterium]|nr:nuclear transport factor 2 family protein [Alphaproteobacteria bacterium]MBV9693521.1 nuclear transport factor 2 family protein [Alphaproteobacteria bacterium]
MDFKPAARAVLALCLVAFAAAQAKAAGNADVKSAMKANAAFYVALNAMFTGDGAPMEKVWSHAADVTYMGPTGAFDIGWAAVGKNFQAQAAMKLGGRIEPDEIHLFVGGNLAVVSEVEVGENTNANGKTAQVKLRATNIFRREHSQWKMIGHHTDTLPYLSK